VRTLVVLPTYQEADNIAEVLRRLRAAVPSADVLVVDDSSPDDTAGVAKVAGYEFGGVDVMVRPQKAGLGSAYRLGFAEGLARGYDVLVEMDSDLSHDPATLPSLLRVVEDGADLAIGSRYVPGGSTPDWPFRRRSLSRYGNRYAAAVLGLSVADSTSGFRAYRAEAVSGIDLQSVQADGYGFQIEMAYRVASAGGRISELPIEFLDRRRGTSKMSGRIIVEALVLVMWWGVRDRLRPARRLAGPSTTDSGRPGWHTARVGQSRTILHVDMDAFYAAVEVQQDPSLIGRPVIVGGTGNRGVVAACSYEARAYGVHSAMPSARARRLCPHAVFLPGRFDLYRDYSRRLHAILTSFTPVVEGIALDEAFLDVTGARRLWGGGRRIAVAVRERIAGEMGLDASVGVATCKLVAKLASEAVKPRATLQGPVPGLGVKVVDAGDELAFLHPHPVSALWGVGPATRRRLDRFGVNTVGDLAALPLETLVGAVGEAVGRHLHALAWARDDRPVEPDRAAKSVGHEETYEHDRSDAADLAREVARLSDGVATRLRRAGLAGRTVTLKVRFGDFRTITRSRTVRAPVETAVAISRVAVELLRAVDLSPGVRLLGVSVANLVEGRGQQLSLDGAGGSEASADEALADVVDQVRRRFGDRAVGPGSLLGAGGVEVKRQGDQQWGPGSEP